MFSGFWRRLIAFYIDCFLLQILAVPIIVIVAIIMEGSLHLGSLAGFDQIISNSFSQFDFENIKFIVRIVVSGFILMIVLLLPFVYFVTQYRSRHKATFGMRALGAKIVNGNDYGLVTVKQCFWRYITPGLFFTIGNLMIIFDMDSILILISGLLVTLCSIFGYLMILFTERKQTLYDLMTDVCVVRAKEVIDNPENVGQTLPLQ